MDFMLLTQERVDYSLWVGDESLPQFIGVQVSQIITGMCKNIVRGQPTVSNCSGWIGLFWYTNTLAKRWSYQFAVCSTFPPSHMAMSYGQWPEKQECGYKQWKLAFSNGYLGLLFFHATIQGFHVKHINNFYYTISWLKWLTMLFFTCISHFLKPQSKKSTLVHCIFRSVHSSQCFWRSQVCGKLKVFVLQVYSWSKGYRHTKAGHWGDISIKMLWHSHCLWFMQHK